LRNFALKATHEAKAVMKMPGKKKERNLNPLHRAMKLSFNIVEVGQTHTFATCSR